MRAWTLAFGLVVPVAATAQLYDGDANLNVFLTVPSYAGCSEPEFEAIDAGSCADLVSEPTGGPGFLWCVASREGGFPDGIGGIQFGVEHDLGAGLPWSLCTGGSEIPEPGWPDSGTGNAITWSAGCYHPIGFAARIGYLSPEPDDVGIIELTPDPRIALAVYADCSAVLYEMCEANLGSAELADGTTPVCGENCEIPIRETSWGAIKSLF